MSSQQAVKAKKHNPNLLEKNPLETIADLGSSSVKKTARELGGIASGVFDQFMGDADYVDYEHGSPHREQPRTEQPKKKEAKPVFRFHEHHENYTVKQEIAEIQQLIQQVKQEIKMIKQQNQSMLAEVKDVEKLTLSSSQENARPYDASFLEVILSLLRTIRLKIGESNTWLTAMVSKRKKRGSAFAARTKSMGTQYSLSQELQVTRNVQ
jgi:hypothetical protein